jgi:hypothetical protein
MARGDIFPVIWAQSSREFAVTYDKQMLYAGDSGHLKRARTLLAQTVEAEGASFLVTPVVCRHRRPSAG